MGVSTGPSVHAPNIALPAGYEVAKINHVTENIVSCVWTVPGGDPIYCHAVTPDDGNEDAFWQKMLERVQHKVQGRWLGVQSTVGGVTTYPRMALSYKPPTTGA